MVKAFRRFFSGCARLMSKDRDHRYFVSGSGVAGRGSHFREDIRAIVGGALAAAMVGAALSQIVSIPFVSDNTFTFASGVVGGLLAKYAFV